MFTIRRLCFGKQINLLRNFCTSQMSNEAVLNKDISVQLDEKLKYIKVNYKKSLNLCIFF